MLLQKDEKGQALVETAITLPVLLMVIFAIIVFGIYFLNMSVMLYATNRALDEGIGKLSGETLNEEDKKHMEETAKNAAGSMLLVSNIEVEVSNDSGETEEENILKVKMSGEFKCMLPFLENIFEDLKVLKVESFYVYKK